MKFDIKYLLNTFISFRSFVYNYFLKIKSVLSMGDGHSRTITWLKILIAAFIVVSFIFILFILSFDFSDFVRMKLPKINMKDHIFSKIEKFNLSYVDSKNNLISLFIKEAEEDPKDNKVFVKNIDTKVVFNTDEWLNIKSVNAVIDKGTSEINLQNNVTITDYKGDILKGENIKLNIKENTAFSDNTVHINSSFGKITSTNGFYAKKGEKYLFKGGIKAKFSADIFSSGEKLPFKNIDIDINSNTKNSFNRNKKRIIKSITNSNIDKLKR